MSKSSGSLIRKHEESQTYHNSQHFTYISRKFYGKYTVTATTIWYTGDMKGEGFLLAHQLKQGYLNRESFAGFDYPSLQRCSDVRRVWRVFYAD